MLTSTATGSLGAMLTADPRVDVISFTGSTATGRRVMESASKTIKRTLLELGGKSAMIVLDDADFSQALLGAANVCANAGQGCVLNTRLLVPRSRYDEAVAILEAVYRNAPYGDPNDANNIMGPMNVNGAFFFSANAPFGGYKQSGIGRENGVEGFEEYLETKTLAVPMDFPATSALAQPA